MFSTNLFFLLVYIITTIIHNVQLFQHHLPRLSVLRAHSQCVVAHPSQRLQARGCARARRRVRPGVLLHVGLCERTAWLALIDTQ